MTVCLLPLAIVLLCLMLLMNKAVQVMMKGAV